ncbi:acyltransferase [Siphonobacter sp. SORGH_AS_1065]|uniref:acyltransferase family protein n=1 Tax=Siphonobacter sp. SORGH_AS_1065 TaxID=3041795 RepID=UPI0027868F2E|nr:acyltransferase [Siphonobacter sp. SORGH_AS_1065]MDQ1085602.1 peptidoglycan/LPS O-acetylase OafA/YrhL [Siphonobacter sp. SORGH_AS_1065]
MTRRSHLFDYNLESLRGFAALFVVVHHMIYYEDKLMPGYIPVQLKLLEPSGHVSVLMFFVISGYVIGLTTPIEFTKKNIYPYLKKRFVRLYPIYFISIVFTLAVSKETYSWEVILGNFTFLKVLLVPVLLENNPIWSLHYEVVFYLLFIPMAYFRWNAKVVMLGAFLWGVLIYYCLTDYPLLTSYGFGFSFWCSGVVIARSFTVKVKQINYSLLISAVFLLLCVGNTNFLTKLLYNVTKQVFHHYFDYPDSVDWYHRAISFLDFSYAPYCIMVVLLFTGKEFKYRMSIYYLLQGLSILSLLFLFWQGNQDVYIFTIYALISLLFLVNSFSWVEVLSQKIIHYGSWIGGISYSLYIIHLPLLHLFERLNWIGDNTEQFMIRLGTYGVLTILISFILEIKFQPWISSFFYNQSK